MTCRYALYFAPRSGSAWARYGEAALAGAARRYGFHATLKAPFRLAEASDAAALIGRLDAWCATRTAFVFPALRLARLEDFVALVPARAEPRIDAIAADCVRRFERFRAPPSAEELARRRRKPLTARQEALLERWGYPYVLEEFRFHLSLTGPLPPDATPRFPSPPKEALVFDSICVFEEPEPGARFRAIHRAPFRTGGRLIYVAGPSGAGKDSILGWAKSRIRGRAAVVFARRTITRPEAEGAERHLAATAEEFRGRHERGEFAMAWEANGQSYGVGQEIREWLARGLTVVVSGSREYAPQALRDFPDMELVHVTAPAALLRKRLVERRREPISAIRSRLERAGRFLLPDELVSTELVNDGDIARAGRQFLDYLLPLRAPTQEP